MLKPKNFPLAGAIFDFFIKKIKTKSLAGANQFGIELKNCQMGHHQLLGTNIILFVHQEISHEPCWQDLFQNENVGACFQNWQIGQNL